MPARRAEPEPQPHRFDATAFLLLAIGGALAAAVLSADAADISGDWAVVRTSSHNLLGPAGAWIARSLVESLGSAVYVFLAGWLILSIDLFLRPQWWPWLRRVAGWSILVPAAAVMCGSTRDRLGSEDRSPGPGGTVGAWLASWLSAELADLGPSDALGAARCDRLAFAIDRIMGFVARRIGNFVRRLVRHVGRIGSWLIRPRPKRRSVCRFTPVGPRKSPERSAAPRTPRPAPNRANTRCRPLELLDEPVPIRIANEEELCAIGPHCLSRPSTDFGLNVKVVGINTGPVITQYEIALETGLRVNRVTTLADDLALNLKVPSVRVVAPIPGKNTVGIEVPNEHRATVRLKELRDCRSARGVGSAAALPRQGHRRPIANVRPRRHAALAHRRPHGHRQIRLPECRHSRAC